MNREDIQKLLGGYATGTLTPAEQQTLFEAALEDQELFDALGKEQALHDLLRDPAARAELLAALDAPRLRWWQIWQVRAGAAVALAGLVVGVVVMRQHPARPTLVAEFKAPASMAPSLPEPQPAPTAQAVKGSTALADKRAAPPAEKDHEASADGGQARAKKIVEDLPARRVAAPVREQESRDEKRVVASDALTVAPKAEAVPAAPPPPPAAVAAPVQGLRQLDQAMASPQAVQKAQETVDGAAAQQTLNLQNARTLFYGNQFTNALQGQAAGAPMEKQKDVANAELKSRVTTGALRGGSAGFLAGAGPNLGLRIEVLHKLADGTFANADAASLNAGDTVKLRVTPNADGFLTIGEGKGKALRTIVTTRRVTRMTAFETVIAPPGRADTKEYLVTFTRQAAVVRDISSVIVRVDQSSYTDPAENATYVADQKSDPTARIVQPVALVYK